MRNFWVKLRAWKLETIVFSAGAVVMIFEIVGSRLLAPYLGTSLITWTSLIGVILASLSAGYYWGGRLADRRADYRLLAVVLLAASLAIATALVIQRPLLTALGSSAWSLEIKSILAAFLLFAPTSVLLGVIAPYAVKLKLHNLEVSGTVVGRLYALSTVGSIVGTFVAGLWLIPFLGTIRIFMALTVFLVVLAFVIWPNGQLKQVKNLWLWLLWLALVVSPLLANTSHNLIDRDTEYARVWIFNSLDHYTRQPIKVMSLNAGFSSAMFLADDELVFPYTKYYRLAKYFNPALRHAVMIGGAAYSYPKDFLDKLPEAELTVVEIDEGVTALAKKYFRLTDDPRLTIIHQDGRTWLNNNRERYDAILVDAFSALYSLPWHLTTQETVRRQADSLTDDGVVLVNVISALEGDKSEFLRAAYATYKSIFPQVYVLPVATDKPDEVQNIMLVALKTKIKPTWAEASPAASQYLKRLWTKPLSAGQILTDDYAPVDNYVNKLL